MKMHTCERLVFKCKETGEKVRGYENVWHCPGCAEIKIWRLDKMLGEYPWEWLITFTADIACAPPVARVLALKVIRKKLFDALEYEYGTFKHMWVIGAGDKGNKLHLHLLWRGPKPNMSLLLAKWKRLTTRHINKTCYIVDLSPAIPTHVSYLGRNAARLPIRGPWSRFKMPWDKHRLKRFRRIGMSRGLIPARPKSKKQWELIAREKPWRTRNDIQAVMDAMQARRAIGDFT